MIDHIGIAVADMERSRAFYVEALKPLSISLLRDVTAGRRGTGAHAAFGSDGRLFFWIGEGPRTTVAVHVAFAAQSRAQVDAFHQAALRAGGKDNGAPGLRPHYHPDYYGAFALDPDGNNIEAVCRKPE